MDRLVISSKGLRWVVPLVFALAAVFMLASTAHAQEQDPMGDQYDPAVTVEDSEGQDSSNSSNSGTDGAVASDSVSASDSSESSSGSEIEALPSTGGPLLPFLALGALALGATGLLVSRRNR